VQQGPPSAASAAELVLPYDGAAALEAIRSTLPAGFRLGRMVREYGPELGHVSSFRRRTSLATALGAHRPDADSVRDLDRPFAGRGPNPAGLLSQFQGSVHSGEILSS
jgi:hypothetical protein